MRNTHALAILASVAILAAGCVTQPSDGPAGPDPVDRGWTELEQQTYDAIRDDPEAPPGTEAYLEGGNLDEAPGHIQRYVLTIARQVTAKSVPGGMMCDVPLSWTEIKQLFRETGCGDQGQGGSSPNDGQGQPGGPPSG